MVTLSAKLAHISPRTIPATASKINNSDVDQKDKSEHEDKSNETGEESFPQLRDMPGPPPKMKCGGAILSGKAIVQRLGAAIHVKNSTGHAGNSILLTRAKPTHNRPRKYYHMIYPPTLSVRFHDNAQFPRLALKLSEGGRRYIFLTSDGNGTTPDPNLILDNPPADLSKTKYSFYRKLKPMERNARYWHRTLGNFITLEILKKRPLMGINNVHSTGMSRRRDIDDFPTGYSLYRRVRHRNKDEAPLSLPREDTYLYGHPSANVFRSVDEFKPHMKWLVEDMKGTCECLLCTHQTSGPNYRMMKGRKPFC